MQYRIFAVTSGTWWTTGGDCVGEHLVSAGVDLAVVGSLRCHARNCYPKRQPLVNRYAGSTHMLCHSNITVLVWKYIFAPTVKIAVKDFFLSPLVC